MILYIWTMHGQYLLKQDSSKYTPVLQVLFSSRYFMLSLTLKLSLLKISKTKNWIKGTLSFNIGKAFVNKSRRFFCFFILRQSLRAETADSLDDIVSSGFRALNDCSLTIYFLKTKFFQARAKSNMFLSTAQNFQRNVLLNLCAIRSSLYIYSFQPIYI